MVSVQVSSSTAGVMAGGCVVDMGGNSQVNRTNQIVIVNDQSVIKGALWGLAAFKFGSATLGVLAYTAVTSPLVVTPLMGIPVALGVSAYVLGSITSSCIDNSMYHLGSRQVRVIQIS